MTSPTVIVKIGPEGKEYILHTELLKHHSGYFRGALSGAFKETDDGVIPITDIETDAFDTFVDWMYRGIASFEPSSSGKHLANPSSSYILADRLLVPGFKSALLDSYCDMFSTPRIRPACHIIVKLFGNLAEDDPLLRLCVDVWAARKAIYKLKDFKKDEASSLPQGFFVRLMLRINELGEDPPLVEAFKREDYSERVRLGG